ncbi:MAG: right-handed parallel beta-helix repeat-containing protein [Candidatus Moranbacteria bacterium]|nr:right-handed parallel beta-helix repeat-containing protein [Candidatus Moranbacteria bacterium]
MVYNMIMKRKIILIFLIFVGISICPTFVLAGYDFYVDADASSEGDGSKDDPFEEIEDALKKGGKEIFVKNGTYKENITLSKNVKIKGESESKTIISGKVTMEDSTTIENLTIKSGGVSVGKGNNVKIDGVTITGAGTGIETEGSGKLKVLNSNISENGKGMYIQKDKDIEIRSSTVSNNGEEGIDIRQNVDGIISGNKIKGNDESGIEVIAGGSELKISGNTLQNNGASGIAIQYYKSADKIGALRVYDNIISSNKNHGITCKNPSGGSPGGSYWTESVDMGANKIFSNKDGEFAPFCKFSDDTANAAIKTEDQLKQEKLVEEKAEQESLKKKEEEENRLILEEEEKAKLKEEALQTERLELEKQERIERDKEKQLKVEDLYLDFLNQDESNNILKKEIENRSKIKSFFIGTDYKKLDQLSEQVLTYNKKIVEIKELKQQINGEEILAQEQIILKINEIESKKAIFKEFVSTEMNKFSLFGWILNLFKRS